MKYDWCSYGEIASGGDPDAKDIPLWGKTAKDDAGAIYPYKFMGKFLRDQKRDIVFSLCQYGMADVWKWGGSVEGNCWRTTGDITDTWRSMSGIGFQQDKAAPFAKPGNWNDPDMLIVGQVGWGNLHPTRLTPDEQYTHISLWCLLSVAAAHRLRHDEIRRLHAEPVEQRRSARAGPGRARQRSDLRADRWQP